MKKILGITIGGLHQKILSFVLSLLIACILVFSLISIYQSYNLSSVVEKTRTEQQEAISVVSEDTMKQVIKSSLTKTNALQAYIADDIFAEITENVKILRSIAQKLFERMDTISPAEFSTPDPSSDGTVTAQVLFEEGADPENSEYLPVAAHMTEIMKAVYINSDTVGGCFIGLADGTHIGIDNTASDKFDENGKQIPFPVRERPWYTGAAEKGDIYYSGVERDSFSGSVGLTCSAPVIVNGKLMAVIGIDIVLSPVDSYISSSSDSTSFVCIINDLGQTVFAPSGNSLFRVSTSDEAEDLRKSENPQLAEFVTDSLTEVTDIRTVEVNGRQYYMAGTPINTVGWTIITVVDKESTEQPKDLMLSEYDRINSEAKDTYLEAASTARTVTIIMVLSLIVLGVVGAFYYAGRIVEPIESMTAAIIEGGRTGKLFEMIDTYNTGDEIEVLAKSFDDLSKKTKQYIIDITRITKEKERIGTELELARKIQADMLPNIYPAFPDRPEFDIYATMTPAKEVGGDFYDFFLIDDDHLGIVMADVSGKGVPAALFMMMSKILINNYAMLGGSPAKVLEKTNAAICKKNEEEMFVTVWFGVLEISTGRITAANAGHEFPIIRKADGKYELFRDKHGFVVGGMDGMKYKDYEMQLEKGGTLFLYTDGLPEATNSDNEMFGTERMTEVLNRNVNEGPRQLLPLVQNAVDSFVGDADKFDDLTMLAVTLK